MPELAEVETVRNVLKKKILKKKIQNIDIIYGKIIENPLPEFKDKLNGEEFIDIQRKGKYLIFETKENYLISHLRMEGKYFLKSKKEPIMKHEHVIFDLGDITLRYHDTRKFGRMKLIDKNELDSFFKDIGPDANSMPDKNYLYQKINKKNIPLKSLLLDQSILAGLGNIYADEVLFASKLSPFQKGCETSLEECQSIINNSKEILDKAIEYKGTTIRSYTSSLGVYGEYQNFLKVHTKNSQKCECGNIIQKAKIGGRSTYYCPNCQKAK